ncbi:hypothetical protein [Actinomadura parmotrematis]|uniref:Uncharacterized protein n=1 Tax=Actinomadura parmotrematis TaxID=2864039 RepID=A0ABS7FLJ3_9ACTN|nr:hypothetical protein [Actinomadura parmotrematis]MBW8481120.1 hypothetical protein [Actinomadura parmotrematis]
MNAMERLRDAAEHEMATVAAVLAVLDALVPLAHLRDGGRTPVLGGAGARPAS